MRTAAIALLALLALQFVGCAAPRATTATATALQTPLHLVAEPTNDPRAGMTICGQPHVMRGPDGDDVPEPPGFEAAGATPRALRSPCIDEATQTPWPAVPRSTSSPKARAAAPRTTLRTAQASSAHSPGSNTPPHRS